MICPQTQSIINQVAATHDFSVRFLNDTIIFSIGYIVPPIEKDLAEFGIHITPFLFDEDPEKFNRHFYYLTTNTNNHEPQS